MSRWSRNIHRCAPTTAALDVAPLMEDPAAWARSTMRSLHLEWLLAHSGDGVTWGRLGADGLATSNQCARGISPPLRSESLHDIRLFGAIGEVFAWRTGSGAFRCRAIFDETGGASVQEKLDGGSLLTEYFDEDQILWGTSGVCVGSGFTRVRDGSQGLEHAVPLVLDDACGIWDGRTRPLRLKVRHYLSKDDIGAMCLSASRLVDLFVEART
jgi:CRISPR-associated protein (TIGR03984 family)